VKTLLVMSILLMTLGFPAAAAFSRAPRKALRGLLFVMALGQVGYALFLLFLFDRIK
jgi:hypothetical protein